MFGSSRYCLFFKKYFFLLAALVVSCGPHEYDSCLIVREVIDGDTIRLANGAVLRYIGLDTPETRIKEKEVWKDDPQPFAREATEFNRSLVQGKCVNIEFDVQRTDKYGRLLGYVFADDRLVNRILLEKGYAVLYTRPPNVRYKETLVSAQREARAENRGLWGAYAIVDAAEAHRYIGEIRRVKGRVNSTYQSDKCVFLNFGRDWRSDFTVVIFTDSLAGFREENIEPRDFYKGKTVEVTGRIREYNGPEIIVNIPEEIVVREDSL